MDRNDFANGMAVLVSGIGRDFTRETCEVWYDCLRDLTVEQFQHAVRRWLCQTNSGFPSIAEIRQLAAESTNGQRLTAADAWGRVLKAVRHFGYYRAAEADEVFDDVTRRALRAVGGFLAVCDCEEISILSGQFRRAYESISDRVEQHARLPADVRPKLIHQPEQRPAAVIEQLADSMRMPMEDPK